MSYILHPTYHCIHCNVWKILQENVRHTFLEVSTVKNSMLMKSWPNVTSVSNEVQNTTEP